MKTIADKATKWCFDTTCFHDFKTVWRTRLLYRMVLYLSAPLIYGSTYTRSFQTVEYGEQTRFPGLYICEIRLHVTYFHGDICNILCLVTLYNYGRTINICRAFKPVTRIH